MKKSIVVGITALVVCGLGVSASAVAASPSQFNDGAISVSFADLNIQNAAGAQVLYTRLQRATGKPKISGPVKLLGFSVVG